VSPITWCEATELQDELRERLEQQHEEAERRARQAEAELMAMIEGGDQPAAAGDAKAVENARKKKQKRQRQKTQAAAAAAAATTTNNGPSLVPQTAPLLSTTASTTVMEAEKARKKKEKRKRQQERKAATKRAAETSVPEPGMDTESGSQARSSSPPMPALAREPQPMPEPPAPERPELQPQPEAALPSPAAESALPLAQLTVEQSVAWLGTVSGLAPDTIEAVGRTFTEHEIDGEDLRGMRPKSLRRILKDCALPEGETRNAAIVAILARRDQQLVAESKPEDCMTCPLSLCLMNDPWTTQVGSTCE
jgi:hypothetical protein